MDHNDATQSNFIKTLHTTKDIGILCVGYLRLHLPVTMSPNALAPILSNYVGNGQIVLQFHYNNDIRNDDNSSDISAVSSSKESVSSMASTTHKRRRKSLILFKFDTFRDHFFNVAYGKLKRRPKTIQSIQSTIYNHYNYHNWSEKTRVGCMNSKNNDNECQLPNIRIKLVSSDCNGCVNCQNRNYTFQLGVIKVAKQKQQKQQKQESGDSTNDTVASTNNTKHTQELPHPAKAIRYSNNNSKEKYNQKQKQKQKRYCNPNSFICYRRRAYGYDESVGNDNINISRISSKSAREFETLFEEKCQDEQVTFHSLCKNCDNIDRNCLVFGHSGRVAPVTPIVPITPAAPTRRTTRTTTKRRFSTTTLTSTRARSGSFSSYDTGYDDFNRTKETSVPSLAFDPNNVKQGRIESKSVDAMKKFNFNSVPCWWVTGKNVRNNIDSGNIYYYIRGSDNKHKQYCFDKNDFVDIVVLKKQKKKQEKQEIHEEQEKQKKHKHYEKHNYGKNRKEKRVDKKRCGGGSFDYYLDFIKNGHSIICGSEIDLEDNESDGKNVEIKPKLDFANYDYYYGLQSINCCCENATGFTFEIDVI